MHVNASSRLSETPARQGFFRPSILRCRSGVTAIEFALVLPILLLLIFGIIEFSLIMFVSVAIESSTSISSRTGKTGFDPMIVDPVTGQPIPRKDFIRAEIQRRVGGLVKLNDVQILTRVLPGLDNIPPGTGDPDGEVGEGGEIVEYTVIYNWPIQTPFLGALIGRNPTTKIGTGGATFEIMSTALVKNEPF